MPKWIKILLRKALVLTISAVLFYPLVLITLYLALLIGALIGDPGLLAAFAVMFLALWIFDSMNGIEREFLKQFNPKPKA
jgi:hypothetical protein